MKTDVIRDKKSELVTHLAASITELICQTNTDERELLLRQVASFLRTNAQGYTAHIFDRAARDYKSGD